MGRKFDTYVTLKEALLKVGLIPFHGYLTLPQKAYIKRTSEEKNISQSEVLRRMLSDVITRLK